MTKIVRLIGRLTLFGLLVSELSAFTYAESPPLWGRLVSGPYPVGFQSSWQLDYSRQYRLKLDDKTVYGSGKAPRPILINMWYPAREAKGGTRMPHRDYLKVQSANPQLVEFSTKLVDYEHTVIVRELLGKPAQNRNEEEKELMDKFLESPTYCIRNAAAAEGRFPLVIYHAGHGSSFEDNSVLCEFLASNGYVVVGSAYQEPGGSTLNIDGKFTSAADMQFLIGCARQYANVDWNHVAVIGHSGGAHAALTYRALGGCAADAVVSLDTTQDYYSVADSRWEPMTTTVANNRKNMVGPLLMVANPHAFFELADSLSSARRYYFTIKDLGHNDFISQGIISKELHYRLQNPGPGGKLSKPVDGEDVVDKTALDAVKAGYESLCAYILGFLNAELKDDAASKEFLAKQYRETKLEGSEPHVVYVPEGLTGPGPYHENGLRLPTPRQFRPYLRENGSEKTIALLRQFHKQAPTHPIYHPVFSLALVGELLDQGKTREAIAFRDYYREAGPDCSQMIFEWAKTYQRSGRMSLARAYYRKVLLLDPSNVEASAKLKELGEEK